MHRNFDLSDCIRIKQMAESNFVCKVIYDSMHADLYIILHIIISTRDILLSTAESAKTIHSRP